MISREYALLARVAIQQPSKVDTVAIKAAPTTLPKYLDTGDFDSYLALWIPSHFLATSSLRSKLQISGSNNIAAVDQTDVLIPAYMEEEIDFTVTIMNAPFAQHPRLIHYVGTMDSS